MTDLKPVGKSAVAIAGAAGASRVLGFARDLILAYVLGAGPIADAFFAAFRLPNVFRRFFAEGSASLALTPAIMEAEKNQGSERAQALARGLFAGLAMVLGAFLIWGEVWTEALTRLLAPGFVAHGWQMALTVDLMRLCLPYVLLVSLAAWGMGVLNARGRFLAPALAPAILNIVLIGAALVAWRLDWSVARVLAGSLLLAGLLQLMLQLATLCKSGHSWRGRWDLRTALPVLGRMGPAILAASSQQLAILLVTILATRLAPGRVSALYYADRLTQLPLGVFAVALGTAALPAFSLLVAQGRTEELNKRFIQSLQVVLFISLPAAAGLMALARPIIELLFGRGAFGPEAVALTAQSLVYLSLGIPGFSLTRQLLALYAATSRIKEAALACLFSLVLCLILGLWLPTALGHIGLALAVSITGWANALILLWRLRHSIPCLRPTLFSLARMGVLSLTMGLGVNALWHFLPPSLWTLALAISSGAAFYLLAARIFPEWRSARALFCERETL